MSDGLAYRFKEETTRGTPLEIKGPKSLIDGAISSSRGPLFNDVTAKPNRSVMGRVHDQEGNVTLDFDMNTNGRSYFSGAARNRSLQTLAIVAQLDGYARRHDAGDPRIAIDLSASQSGESGYIAFGHDFKITFERPDGELQDVATSMKHAMVRAADILHLYSTTDHSASAAVRTVGEGGLEVLMGMNRANKLIAISNPSMPSETRRIELIGQPQYSDEERLALLLGVIAALPDTTA